MYLSGQLHNSIIKGVAFGIATAVGMLLITQLLIIPFYNPPVTNDQPDNSPLTLSPQDWDFTNTSKLIEDLSGNMREDAMIGYTFANGYFKNTTDSVIISTLPFYGNRSLIFASPVFEEYPKVVEIGTPINFSIEMKIYPSFPSGISIQPRQFKPIVHGFANAIANTSDVKRLNDSELQQYKQQYYQVNNTILFFSHLYSDGSVLQVEIINSAIILIQFVVITHLVIYENGFDYQKNSTEYYLFDLNSFNSSNYIDSVITMINEVEG